MEILDPWNVLLTAAGKSLEESSKMLKDTTDLSINDLQTIRDNLKAVTDALDLRIDALQARK